MKNSYQSRGALAKARNIRNKYLLNPNTCLTCKNPILPEEGKSLYHARIKKFCNHTCAAIYTNTHRESRRICIACGCKFKSDIHTRKKCNVCFKNKNKDKSNDLDNKTKKEVSRRSIASNTVCKMKGREKICQKCGYNLFVEICHIKAVKDFLQTDLVKNINDPNNLIYLCPNCHKEFDSGLWKL